MTSPNEIMRREEGAAAVEFALVMVLLMILIFGAIEFGIAFSKVNVYTGAAREGARYAAVRCDGGPCDIPTKVSDAAAGYYIGPGTPTADRLCDATTVGDPVTVSWDQDITVNIPFIPGLNPATITRHVEGVFRCE
jgi:Flp pilus assembly pilin Flp